MDTRSQLRQKCLAFFLRHGVADLSLRPLAAAVGTSARMLIHYFGSKEALIGEVMTEVQRRFQESFKGVAEKPSSDKQSVLTEFWSVLSRPGNRPTLRLLFEVQILALQNPRRYRRYLNQTSTGWRELIQEALPRAKANDGAATLYNAVIDGLLLDLLSTGDLRRTTRALKEFAKQCRPAQRSQKPTAG
jgi:AcrR family transcriptional regulator